MTTMQQVALGNNTISYLVDGTGPGVILLHGAGTDAATTWGPLMAQLAPTHRVLALNLPSAGATTWPDATVTLSQLSAAVLAVAAAEGLDTFALVGYSTGAMVALQVAGSAPATITKLVVLAPWLTNDARTRFYFKFRGDLLAADPGLSARFSILASLSLASQLQLDDATLDGMASQTTSSPDLLKLMRMNEELSVEPVLAAVTAPALVIAFTEDQTCPPAYARQVAERITASTLLEVPAGHAGPWEAAAVVQSAIVDFLIG